MSGYYNRNNRGITKKLGPVTAYADAVLAGYTGTREQWAQDMAKLGQNVTQVAQNTKLTTELATQTEVNTEQVAKNTADVRRLAEETSDNAVQVASNTAESNRLAEETKQAAAQAKVDAEYAGAAADNFRVDTTLSEEGKAAEAKTTGEKFAQLSEEIDEVENAINSYVMLNNGATDISIKVISEGCVLEFGSTHSVRVYRNNLCNSINFTAEVFVSSLVGTFGEGIYIADNRVHFQCPHGFCAVLDKDDIIRGRLIRDIRPTDIVLIATNWSDLYGGLVDYWKSTLINKKYDFDAEFVKVEVCEKNRVNIIVANDGEITETVYSNRTDITLKNDIMLMYHNKQINIPLSKFGEVVDGKVTVSVPNTRCIAYYYETDTVSIVSETSHSEKTILLFAEHYGNNYGALHDIAEIQRIESALEVVNAQPRLQPYVWQDKCREFDSLFSGVNKASAYLFFTDAHVICDNDVDKYVDNIKVLSKHYNSTPTNFIVFGGDSINESDTIEEDIFRLGYFNGIMKSQFKNYYPIVGNHDICSERTDRQLSDNEIKNLWGMDSTYYHFDDKNSRYYCLNTGTNKDYSLTDFRIEQLKWLCNDLKTSDKEHNAIFMHIALDGDGGTAISDEVGLIIQGYNNRTSYTIGNETFDFSRCMGKVDYVMAGHTHADSVTTLGGVPCVVTSDMKPLLKNTTFDLVFVNYDTMVMNLIRVGSGENRTVSLIN